MTHIALIDKMQACILWQWLRDRAVSQERRIECCNRIGQATQEYWSLWKRGKT